MESLYVFGAYKYVSTGRSNLYGVYKGVEMKAMFVDERNYKENGKLFVIFFVDETYWGGAYRSGGHWHGGGIRGICRVYFRKNFDSVDDGNEFYKRMRANGWKTYLEKNN